MSLDVLLRQRRQGGFGIIDWNSAQSGAGGVIGSGGGASGSIGVTGGASGSTNPWADPWEGVTGGADGMYDPFAGVTGGADGEQSDGNRGPGFWDTVVSNLSWANPYDETSLVRAAGSAAADSGNWIARTALLFGIGYGTAQVLALAAGAGVVYFVFVKK